ncbi:MAG TPA: GGDEF domain-containing protein, partial [Gammaproteobacteria bacterium]|nr:GGDEF domain-containing protein [Gammaproteobacteria bacterium]
NSSSVVLLLIDLDGFKKINDTKGHLAGDGILKEVSGRLLDVTRNTGTVSRIGGDEFIVILPEAQENEVEEILKRIINIFTQPCLIDGEFLSIHLSIGAAIYPQHGVEPKTLIHNADSAMYRAKQTGKEYLIYRG